MTATLAQTPLHDWHAAHGARLVDFAGWSMPVQYSSIVAEHVATRTAAGLFDISHMGRLRFDGPDAVKLIDSLVTRNIATLKPGGIRYALVTNDSGGVKDDVLVYHLQDAAGASYYLMVVNASNREKILAWIEDHHPAFADVLCTDLTHQWAMIAVQGPLALEIVQPLVDYELGAMKYYSGVETSIAGHGGIISRTGYTGEDGVELIVGNAVAEELWNTLWEAGRDRGVLAAGLGARDTLRLEAGMPLYGHELTEELNPLQAGLGFAVNLEKRTFPGREEIAKSRADNSRPRLVGLEIEGKRPAREGHAILADGGPVGHVTSGTFSPTFKKPIAMGYVAPRHTAEGTKLTIDIRGQAAGATVVPLPFYRRPR
jgi:aminomethyltransferase